MKGLNEMASGYPPGFYDDETLKTVESTFREVCEALATAKLASGCDIDGLRVAVIQQLLKFVDQGVIDPNELRTLTLSHFGEQPHA
jgi:hypothetical protein